MLPISFTLLTISNILNLSFKNLNIDNNELLLVVIFLLYSAFISSTDAPSKIPTGLTVNLLSLYII